MRWRWITAALLGGLVWMVSTGGAAAGTPQVGPEWVLTSNANPALVAFQRSASRGQAGLAVDWLSPDPLDLTIQTFCTLPDTGEGAGALVLKAKRVFYPNATSRENSYTYTLGRRLNQRWAAGAGVRFVQSSSEVDTVGTLPEERRLGFDFGALYLPDERTWVGAAVHDALGTFSYAGGSSGALTASYSLDAGRQLSPALKLALEATNLAPGETASVGLRSELALRGWTIRAGASSGEELNWKVGLATGRRNVSLEAAVQGTETRIGGALGVTAQW